MGFRSSLRCLLPGLVLMSAVWITGCDSFRDSVAVSETRIGFHPVREPVIAVLAMRPPRVLLLDQRDLHTLQEVPLRSLSIDMDCSDARVLTAQCGPPGERSDTAIGVLDLVRGTGTYIETGHLGPERVVDVDGSWAFSLSSSVLEAGMGADVLDLDEMKATGLTVPHGTRGFAAIRGRLWLAERWFVDGSETPAEYLYEFGADRSARPLSLDARDVAAIADTGVGVVVVRWRPQHPETGRAELYSYEEALVRSVDLTGLAGEPVAVVGDGAGGFAVLSARGEDGPGSLVFVPGTADAPSWTVAHIEGPVALAGAPDAFVVGSRSTGEVRVIRATDGKVMQLRKVFAESGELADVGYCAVR